MKSIKIMKIQEILWISSRKFIKTLRKINDSHSEDAFNAKFLEILSRTLLPEYIYLMVAKINEIPLNSRFFKLPRE